MSRRGWTVDDLAARLCCSPERVLDKVSDGLILLDDEDCRNLIRWHAAECKRAAARLAQAEVKPPHQRLTP